MRVRCTNKACLHEWFYRGKLGDNDYITCAKCRYKSLIKKAKLSEKSTDLLTDLHNKSRYKKEVVKPNVEHVEKNHYSVEQSKDNFIEVEPHIFVEKKIAKQFMEAPDEEELEEEVEEELNSHFQEIETKLCDEHNLPANYNSSCKKWICENCEGSKIEISRAYTPYEKDLVTVKEIPPKIKILRTIPRDPLAALPKI